MDWLLSIVSVLWLWMTGNRWRWTWYLSLALNILWIVYAINIQQYGLIPGSIAFCIVAVRNEKQWLKDGVHKR